MYFIKLTAKTLFALPLLSAFLLNSYLGKLMITDPKKRRLFFTKTVSFYSSVMIYCLNVNLESINLPKGDEPLLLVGNHMGFLDILLIASVKPCLFVTSVEMRETPVLGTLCEMAGCIFVERRSRLQIGKEIDEIRNALKDGFTVVLYPEGTSTNGEKILPFKKSLLVSAAGSGAHIQPMVLNFTHVNGIAMNPSLRDYVCWYGDQSFAGSLWAIITVKEVRATLEFLEQIPVKSEEQRREVAHQAQTMIESRFRPIV